MRRLQPRFFFTAMSVSVAMAAASAQAETMYTNVSPSFQFAIGVSETVAGADSQVTNDFPGGERPAFALDGTNETKYLAFDGQADDGDATDSGMIVFFSSPVQVEAIRFGIANDAPERDPGSFTLEGSNSVTPATYNINGSGNAPAALVADAGMWTPIVGSPASTGITNVADTFLDAFASRKTYTDELPFERMADDFTNGTAYTAYRILFQDLRFAGNGIMQVGEVELLVEAVPEPTTVVLGALGLVACVAGRRS